MNTASNTGVITTIVKNGTLDINLALINVIMVTWSTVNTVFRKRTPCVSCIAPGNK